MSGPLGRLVAVIVGPPRPAARPATRQESEVEQLLAAVREQAATVRRQAALIRSLPTDVSWESLLEGGGDEDGEDDGGEGGGG